MTPRRSEERGTGLIASVAAVAAFCGFLLLASAALVHLHARSVTTAIAADAARRVAADSVDHTSASAVADAMHDAEADARLHLGRLGANARFDWSGTTGGTVRLTLAVPVPGMVAGFGPPTHRLITRTVTQRVERVR